MAPSWLEMEANMAVMAKMVAKRGPVGPKWRPRWLMLAKMAAKTAPVGSPRAQCKGSGVNLSLQG